MGARHAPPQTLSIYVDSMETMNGTFRKQGNTRSWSGPPTASNAVQTLTTKPSSTEVMEIHAITVKVELA